MLSQNHNFASARFVDGVASRDAVDGFAAIAAALDYGLDAEEAYGAKILDLLAIGLGWIVLASVIFYPQLQLAAIAMCATFLLVRSFARRVFDLGASFRGQSNDLRNGEAGFPAV